MLAPNFGVHTNRFRQARFKWFEDLLDPIARMKSTVRILDLGGTPEYWADKIDLLPSSITVTLLNLAKAPVSHPRMFSVRGNACSMPEFADFEFDVIHSNSVIEHVGRWHDMMAMAQEISRIAPAYFVQTPYFWFPIEPHARTPLLHWLPESIKLRIVMNKKCGFWTKCTSVDQAMRTIQDSSLLDRKMFQALFPDATIVSERVLGLTKSLVAIRKSYPSAPHR